MHIQADRATHPSDHRHPSPPPHAVVPQRTSGTTTQTDTSSTAQSRQVAGTAERKARARSPPNKTAYPSAFSQQSPRPRSTDPKIKPGRSHNPQFHASKSDSSRRHPVDCPSMSARVPGYICLASLRVSGLRLIVVMPWCKSPVTSTAK
jgi:hypothetical protein